MTGERKQLVRALVDALYAWNTTTAGTKAAREAGVRAVEAERALAAFDASHAEPASELQANPKQGS